jgi:hypothetical protein
MNGRKTCGCACKRSQWESLVALHGQQLGKSRTSSKNPPYYGRVALERQRREEERQRQFELERQRQLQMQQEGDRRRKQQLAARQQAYRIP